MNGLKKLGALIVASMIAQAATAGGATEGLKTEMIYLPNLGKIPYAQLFEETSKDGESLEAFMARVGVRMREFSDQTGFEACAAVASDGKNRYGVTVGTNTSHIACAILAKKVPDGMTAMYKTIHTHGENKTTQMNPVDMKFRGVPENARARRMHGTVWGQTLNAFSDLDLKGPPGYLATPGGGLLHHDGEGVVHEVKL